MVYIENYTETIKCKFYQHNVQERKRLGNIMSVEPAKSASDWRMFDHPIDSVNNLMR